MTYFNSFGVAMPESAAPATTLYGTSAAGETLTAPAGPSGVSGEGGGDTLIGNSGDITFYIDHPHDVVQQAAGTSGTKTAIAYTWYHLPANVQNLISNGSFNYAAGNSLPNLIVVNGDQWLDGGAGDDVLVGGSGRATFEVRAGEGSDVIYGWHSGDHIRLLDTSLSNIAQITASMTQAGADVVIQIDASETLTVRNMTIAQFSAADFLLPLDQSKLGALTFSDDFNTLNLYDPSTDTGMWQTNFGGNLKDTWAYTLVPNGEHQSYVTPDFRGTGDHPFGYNPFSINNGILSITAAPIPLADQQAAFFTQYYSGMINTFDTFEQKYGYFEIRAEFPSVAGVWPGLWMQTVPWKPNIEADIAEARGVESYIHYVRAYGGEGNTQTLYDDAYMRDPSGFHTYGMLWAASTVSFYVDGIAVMSGPTPSTWTDPMALIANFAIGGWGGPVDDSHMPATMRIDYVRAYGLADGSSIVDTSRPAPPAATVRLHGSPISSSASEAQLVVPNFDSGGPVTGSTIVFSATAPNQSALPPGETFFVWVNGGTVFGARSDGSQLAPATALLTGTLSQFQAGTWLTDHRVALSYLQTNNGVQNTWAMLFDPFTQTVVNKQQLGAASGNVHLVPTLQAGFAVSWTSGDVIQGRAFDAHAYDQSGWFGETRPFSGDLLGINGVGELVTGVTDNTSVRQLYDVLTAQNTVPASISLSPLMVSHPEGDSGLTNYSYTVTRSWNFGAASSVDWSVIGNAGNPANAADFQDGVYPSGTITFAIGETTKVISFNVVGDTQSEADETFTVTLSHVSGAVLGQAVVNGTIVNDEGMAPATTVQTSEPTYTMLSNVVNVELIGTGPQTVAGNALDNGMTSSNYAATLYGMAGNDSLYGHGGNDVLQGGAGNDYLDGGAGFDVASYADASGGVNVDLNIAGNQNVGGGAGIDTLVNVEYLIGSNFGDTLIGNAINNYLSGGAGNDYLQGGAGNDYLNGGAGFDVASYADASGGVNVDLNIDGDQNVGGGAGSDALVGIEYLVGSNFGDRLIGNGVNNYLSGGAGNDYLLGSAGDDYLTGGTGFDVASYADASGGVSVDLNIVGDQNVGGGAGSDALVGIEYLVGSNFGDRLIGNGVNNYISGGGGNDILQGGAGDDYLTGDAGFDVASYADASGGVSVDLNIAGDQNVGGGSGSDALVGIEYLIGSNFGDTLIGNAINNYLSGLAGNDVLQAGAGDDCLVGGAGNDSLSGGTGADVFAYNAASEGGDTITDFLHGTDKIDLAAIDAGVLTFQAGATTSVAAHSVNWYETGGNTVVQADVNGNTTADFQITLLGTGLGLTAADFVL